MDAAFLDVCNGGLLSSFLSNTLKTNQLEVNTDAKTSKPIARLKEPRDLFALPKDKENDCPQQAARWPTECQVLEERVSHIEYVPETAEPYFIPTGRELQPRPVGEENGVVVFNYQPISAVNYKKLAKPPPQEGEFQWPDNSDGEWESSDEDDDDDDASSTDSRSPTPPTKTNHKFVNSIKTISKHITDFDDSDDDSSDDDEQKSKPNAKSNKNNFTYPIPSTFKLNSAALDEYDFIRMMYNKPRVRKTQNKKPSQFSRSCVGGSKYLMHVHPNAEDSNDQLLFESRFESGNLAKAVKITSVYYELYLRPDLYTNRHTQWFYFRVTNMKKGVSYRFSIVNLMKSDSLYNEGMRPLMYSTAEAREHKIGWRRCGENISYFKNDDGQQSATEEEEDYGCYTLTFNIEFAYEKDTVYFAHSYPYTYTEMQDYLMAIQRHPVKSKYCKLRLLCRSLAGNNVYYLTVTAPIEEEKIKRRKKAIVVSARVHPGETPSSWMMKGLMDFITGESTVAKRLRHRYIFKLIPMLNPDGVIVGNTRSSLTGKDLNRQYRTVIRETYPSIWYTKTMIKRLTEECGVVVYCDMHAHSRKHNIFIYGCENKRVPEKKLTEQVFPLMLHKNQADKFSFENCRFRVQRNKEGTGRIVIWMLGITNSYTIEASFGGSTLGSRANTHFSIADFEQLGRAFCETLMDYGSDNPLKVQKTMKRLKKIRKKERKARNAWKRLLLDDKQQQIRDIQLRAEDLFMEKIL